jgi:amino acid permease
MERAKLPFLVGLATIAIEEMISLAKINRYTTVAAFPILYIGWKTVHKTSIVPSDKVDLQQDLDEIEVYCQNYIPAPPRYDTFTYASNTVLISPYRNVYSRWFNRLFN